MGRVGGVRSQPGAARSRVAAPWCRQHGGHCGRRVGRQERGPGRLGDRKLECTFQRKGYVAWRGGSRYRTSSSFRASVFPTA